MNKLKAKLKNYFKLSKEFVNNNIFLFCYIIGVTLNSYLLRVITFKQYFAIAPLFADLGMSILFGVFYFFIKPHHRNRYIIILTILTAIVCFANALYYSYYDSFASITFISMLFVNYDTGGVNVTENVINFSMFLTLLFPVIMFVIYYILHKRKNNIKIENDKKYRKYLLTTWIVSLVILLPFLRPIDFGRLYTQWNREYIVSKFGIYIYQINDLVHGISPTIGELFGSDQAYVNMKNYYKENKKEQTINEYTNIYEGKNLIVIHYESMQQVAMNTKFNGQEVTPVLNKLTKEGIYFNNFYSQVSVGTSSDTEFTFSTSLMPVNNGTVFINHQDKNYVSIPSLLKEKGYYAFSMHANNGSFWNRKNMHKTLGYDTMYDKASYVIDETIGFGLTDKSFYQQSVPIIKELSENSSPFYATIITLSNHTPFSETEKFGRFAVTKNINGTEYPYMENTKLGNYFKSAHYADQQLGLFIDLLDQSGLLENTVLVIYGDHDARISKSEYNRFINYDYTTDGILDESNPKYQKLDYYWYELNRKVPLLIWTKDNQKSVQVDTVMGMYDALPTLGNMFNFKSEYALGNDIFNQEDNVVVFPNGNWITNKVYYNSGKGEYKLLQDVTLTEDYIEKNNNYSKSLLNVSNDIIVYDLIKKDQTKEEYDKE